MSEEELRIRYLTPRECLRLMGQTDDAIDKLMEVEKSKTAQYRMAGNSIVVDVLMAIFKGIYIDDTFDRLRPKQTSLEGWE
jgi:DNA (cytosine-5)-methyltransferase 1